MIRAPLCCWCVRILYRIKCHKLWKIHKFFSRAEISGISVSELKTLEIAFAAFLSEINYNLGLSPGDNARLTDGLLLFATLRAASMEPWRLAALEPQVMTMMAESDTEPLPASDHAADPPNRQADSDDASSSGCAHHYPPCAGRDMPSTHDPKVSGGCEFQSAPVNPSTVAAAAAAAVRALLVAGCWYELDQPPSPPSGSASPELPWTMRRAEGASATQQEAA
jgi:hypothetical protein